MADPFIDRDLREQIRSVEWSLILRSYVVIEPLMIVAAAVFLGVWRHTGVEFYAWIAGTLLIVQVQRRLIDHDRRLTLIEIGVADLLRSREADHG